MRAIILAAGMGTRLGTLIPKPLTAIHGEKTIIDFQIEKLSEKLDYNNIVIVVGYKKEIIMERHPGFLYVYNNKYTLTNTGKSLSMAIDKFDEDILWMNGDVFFDIRVLDMLLGCSGSCILVDNKECGKEEVKYNMYNTGYVKEISKQVKYAAGEALGINLIRKKDLLAFKEELRKINDEDYFEKALENLTLKGAIELTPINKGDYFCQEIDFQEDLDSVINYINQ